MHIIKIPLSYILLFSLFLIGCNSTGDEKQIANPNNPVRISASLLNLANDQNLNQLAELSAWKKDIKEVLALKMPIMLLDKSDLSQPDLFFAQAVALNDKAFMDQSRLENGDPVLNLVTDIRMASKQELKLEKLAGQFVLVEKYNYYYNTVTKAFIDEQKKEVIKIGRYPGKHPTLRKKLKKIVSKIALAYPLVLEQLGAKSSLLSSDYDVEIRDSKCERSRHLCSAVLVTKKGNNETLWILVDLTTLQAIGFQWLPIWNPKRPKIVTERSLQNEVVVDTYCGDTLTENFGKWTINYTLTESDGIEIFDVVFNNIKVLHSAKIVDWHVSYPDKKDFGYSDAMGCPKFSSAAVVAFEGPDIQPIMKNGQKIGFSFIQDFRSPVWPKGCNYRYQNLYEFYDDGRFRIAGINLGLGCSTNGWYRPVFRIDLSDDMDDVVAQWNGNGWSNWTHEQWHLQKKTTKYSPEGYLFKFINKSGKGYFLEPNQGQFNDNSRGDHAFSYVSVKNEKRDEGVSDMSTFGKCCNTDYQQGPEKYISPAEQLTGKSIFWYVPQMKNSAQKGSQYCWVESYAKDGYEAFRTYPGVVGPMFVPINLNHD